MKRIKTKCKIQKEGYIITLEHKQTFKDYVIKCSEKFKINDYNINDVKLLINDFIIDFKDIEKNDIVWIDFNNLSITYDDSLFTNSILDFSIDAQIIIKMNNENNLPEIIKYSKSLPDILNYHDTIICNDSNFVKDILLDTDEARQQMIIDIKSLFNDGYSNSILKIRDKEVNIISHWIDKSNRIVLVSIRDITKNDNYNFKLHKRIEEILEQKERLQYEVKFLEKKLDKLINYDNVNYTLNIQNNGTLGKMLCENEVNKLVDNVTSVSREINNNSPSCERCNKFCERCNNSSLSIKEDIQKDNKEINEWYEENSSILEKISNNSNSSDSLFPSNNKIYKQKTYSHVSAAFESIIRRCNFNK